MAYGLLAEFTFLTQPTKLPGAVDRLKRVRFLKRDYTGPALTIHNGGTAPVIISKEGDSDDRFTGVLPLRLRVTISVDSQEKARLFYVTDEREIQVLVEQVNVSGDSFLTDFQGWLTNGNLQTPYAPQPYPLSLTAICGLSLLKTRPLLTVEGRYPVERLSLRALITGALHTTGYDLPLLSICNLRETADRTPARLPRQIDVLDHLLLPAEIARLNAKSISAWAFLEHVCESFNASLQQQAGRWVFARENERLGGHVPMQVARPAEHDVFGLVPDENGVIVPDTLNFVRLVGKGLPNTITKEGPTLSLEPTQPIVAVRQTFGEPLSVLKNGAFADLAANGFPTSWAITHPTYATGITRRGNGSPADPFRLRIEGSGENGVNINAPQVVGAGQLISFRDSQGRPTRELIGQPLRLTGQFRGASIRSAKLLIVAKYDPVLFPGILDIDFAFLSNEGTWTPRPNRAQRIGLELDCTLLKDKHLYTKEGWIDIDVTLPAHPAVANVADFEVYVCQGNALRSVDPTVIVHATPATAFIEYRDLVLSVGDPQTRFTGITYTVTNYRRVDGDAVLEQPVEPRPVLTIADAPSAIRGTSGTLIYTDGAGITVPAYRFGHPRQTAQAVPGKPLVVQCALERAAQVARPALLIEATVSGHLPHGPLTILQITDQPGADGPAYFALVGWEWDMRKEHHRIVGLEILRQSRPLSITATWQTAEGDIAADTDPATRSGLDDIPDPLPPKKGTVIGKPTYNEIVQGVGDNRKPAVLLLNSGAGGSGRLADVDPLLDEDVPPSYVEFSSQNKVIQRSRFTDAERLTFISPPLL